MSAPDGAGTEPLRVGHHWFQLGAFRCLCVSDGAMNYPTATLFHGAPTTDVEAALRHRNLPTKQVTTSYTSLPVDTGQNRVLVDTGAGSLSDHASQVFPGLDHTTSVTGTLVENLRAAGIEPTDIDNVVITHAHPDHIGGTLNAAGALPRPTSADAGCSN